MAVSFNEPFICRIKNFKKILPRVVVTSLDTMRQAFHPGLTRRSVGLPECYRQLEVYDPRFDESANHEMYNARMGYCAPTSISNEMR